MDESKKTDDEFERVDRGAFTTAELGDMRASAPGEEDLEGNINNIYKLRQSEGLAGFDPKSQSVAFEKIDKMEKLSKT